MAFKPFPKKTDKKKVAEVKGKGKVVPPVKKVAVKKKKK